MTRSLLVLSALLFVGCPSPEPVPTDAPVAPDVPGETDAPEPVDAPAGPAPSETCGDPEAQLLLGPGETIEVDTTTADPDFTIIGTPSSGNDVFLRLNAVSGELWHFHLAALSPGLDPVLYVTQATGGVCGSSPVSVRNACDAEGDEHFAFIAPTTGEYFVGIDTSGSAGGRMRLQATRPVCGNGTQEHGEPCDEGATGTATCTDTCHIILSDVSGTGSTAVPVGRHNDTANEAMVVELTGPSLDVTGFFGLGDCYPDVLAIDLAAGDVLSVTARDSTTGDACASIADAPYELELRNGADTRIAGGSDAMGCPNIDYTATDAGRVFIWIRGDAIDASVPYAVRIARTTP